MPHHNMYIYMVFHLYSIISNNALALFWVGLFSCASRCFFVCSKPIATVGGRGRRWRQILTFKAPNLDI